MSSLADFFRFLRDLDFFSVCAGSSVLDGLVVSLEELSCTDGEIGFWAVGAFDVDFDVEVVELRCDLSPLAANKYDDRLAATEGKIGC